MVKAQDWLDQNYPKDGVCIKKNSYRENNYGKTRNQITMMNIESQNLEGGLDLSDFVNLEMLNCSNNLLEFLLFFKREDKKKQ